MEERTKQTQIWEPLDQAFWGTFYYNANNLFRRVFMEQGIALSDNNFMDVLKTILNQNALASIGELPYRDEKLQSLLQQLYPEVTFSSDFTSDLMKSVVAAYSLSSDIIKAVAFHDYSSSNGENIKRREENGENVWAYISNHFKGRTALKKMHIYLEDCVIAKSAMASWAMSEDETSLVDLEEEYKQMMQQKAPFIPGHGVKMTAFVTFLNPYLIPSFLAMFPEAKREVLDELFRRRYGLNQAKKMDDFKGQNQNSTFAVSDKISYYETYHNLEKNFSLMAQEDDLVPPVSLGGK